MKRIAVIGANEFQNPLILKAKELGYETHVFAWASGDIGERNADFFYPVSIVEKDEILAKCRELQIDAICSIGSDLAVLTVNHVARAMGLPCNPEFTDTHATNKHLMREAFQSAGVPVPKFVRTGEAFDPACLAGFTFPVIVKPTDRSGSRGIFKAETAAEVSAAVKAACAHSFEHCAIIEEFITGEEYSAECISHDGIHRILAYTKKFTTGAPNFIEMAHLEPADLSAAMKEKIETAVFAALDALQIRMGASHPEFRITPDGEVRIIEVGARMGGDCIGSHLVPLSTGCDFVKMVLDTALGNAPDFTVHPHSCFSAIRFLYHAQDRAHLEGMQAEGTSQLRYVSEIEADAEQAITDSASRHGYYIVAGNEEAELRKLIRL